ncbi:MAG: hypothetical protein WCK37_01310 [Candidatus Falkowbacteria bacterium]
MKKIKIILLVLGVSFGAMSQTRLQQDAAGNVRIKLPKQTDWHDLNVLIDPGAEKYLPFVKEAIKNPGDTILVDRNHEFVFIKMIGLTQQKSQREELGIVFVESDNKIICVSGKTEKVSFPWSFVLMVASLVLMLLANFIFFRKNAKILSSVIALVSAITILAAFTTLNDVKMFGPAVAFSFVLSIITLFAFCLATFYAGCGALNKKHVIKCDICYMSAAIFSFLSLFFPNC